MMGLWIEVEGPDGSGKGTQTRLLVDALRDRGHLVHETHEPWEGGPRGRLIRDVLRHRVTELPAGSGKIDPTLFQWQYVYNRTDEHYPAVIGPGLARGATVVSDRGRLSTYVYGSAFGVSDEMIHEWHQLAYPMRPDLLIYLQTAAKVCMGRLHQAAREGEPEYFERADKIARVVKSYDLLVPKYFSDIAVTIDNNRGLDQVARDVLKAVLSRLGGR